MACENAGGNWTRSPCITLQECIDNRPKVPPGYCRNDKSIQCRDSTPCPLVKPETGHCNGKGVNPGGVCTIDSECPEDPVCKFGEDVRSDCIYNPGQFETFAEGLIIKNATDLQRCEEVRTDLGFQG